MWIAIPLTSLKLSKARRACADLPMLPALVPPVRQLLEKEKYELEPA